MAIRFYSTNGLHGCFSNFSAHPFELDGKRWPTSEHYFQAQKFAGTPREEEIRRAPSPMAAARMGRSRRWPIRSDWERVKDEVMRRGVLRKFQTHSEIREVLLSTDGPIVEATSGDLYWGCGADGSGRNMLGKILMETRERLSFDPAAVSDDGSAEPEVLATGRHLRFVKRNGWEFVERLNVTGIVLIVAITDEGNVLVLEQFREPVRRNVFELPAGLVGDEPGEAAESETAAAGRELLEETGYTAENFVVLSEGPPSPGVCDEIVTLYLASGLRKAGPGGGIGSERIRVHEVPLERAAIWLLEKERQGCLVDPKTYAGLFLASRCREETEPRA